jgi:hypothetical protein
MKSEILETIAKVACVLTADHADYTDEEGVNPGNQRNPRLNRPGRASKLAVAPSFAIASRNPKFETSSKFESLNVRNLRGRRSFEFWIWFIGICFGFQDSDFGFGQSPSLVTPLLNRI